VPDDENYGSELNKETVIDGDIEYEIMIKYRKTEGYMTLAFRVARAPGKNEYKQLIQVDERHWDDAMLAKHNCDTKEAFSRKIIGRIYYHILEHATVDKDQAKVIRYHVIQKL